MINLDTVKNTPAPEVRTGDVIHRSAYDEYPAKVVNISIWGAQNVFYGLTLDTGETRSYRADRYVITAK